MLLVILIIAIVLIVIFFKTRKIPKLGNVSCITGGVKTGKSTLAMYLAKKQYNKHLLQWKIKCKLCKIFRRKKPLPEKPLFYSNVKVGFEYVPLTREIFLREQRPTYKSVIYCQESSLIADSQDWKDKNINERLKYFNKLYGHETKGGYLYYDTQTMKDNHYAIKRCMNSYLWIHHAIKWIPFIYVVKVREMFFSEDGENVNVSTEDVENKLKWIIVPKKIWKYFDCYTYSIMTDNLPVANKTVKIGKKSIRKKRNFKTNYIIDLREQKENEDKKKT